MNTLHLYRRDYSHRRNERVGAKFENELPEAQANLTRLLKTRTNVRKSPRLNFLPRKASLGASNSYYFQSMQSMLYYFLFLHLSFQELIETIDA